MSVKMVAEFRKKPSLARLKAAREERARARAEELSALELFTRNQLVGIDFGVVDPEVVEIQSDNAVRWQPGHLDRILGN